MRVIECYKCKMIFETENVEICRPCFNKIETEELAFNENGQKIPESYSPGIKEKGINKSFSQGRSDGLRV